MHPLISSLDDLKDDEIESKIRDLTTKYFQSSNAHVRNQIAMLLESYNYEIEQRRAAQLKDLFNKRDVDLDDLIDVN